jgi:hypothetical protein
MSDDNNQQLVDESHFPLQNAIGQPIDYRQVLDADLLELLGAENLSEEDRQKVYETAVQTIENRVLARVVDELTDEDLEAWEKIPETDKAALKQFLDERGIDLAKLYVAEAIQYKSEIASLTHQLKISE